MQAHQIEQNEAPKRTPRKRSRKIVLKNVVSLRISDKEKQVLEKITRSTAKSVSDVVREAIEYWLSNRGQRLCRES